MFIPKKKKKPPQKKKKQRQKFKNSKNISQKYLQ